MISEIQKKTSVGVCGGRSMAVPISPSSPAAAALLSFSHPVVSPGWCVSSSSSTAGLLQYTWRSAKAKGFVAKARPALVWTGFFLHANKLSGRLSELFIYWEETGNMCYPKMHVAGQYPLKSMGAVGICDVRKTARVAAAIVRIKLNCPFWEH